MTVEVVTFGCRLNALESEKIAARAAADGLSDAVVFNTCAVTGEAVRQARQAIRRARRDRPDARILVTGCAAEIDPAAFAGMDGVERVVGNGVKAAPGVYGEAWARAEPAAAGPPRARAFVAVQNGCDHRCTFCVIPFGRGDSRSTPGGDVVAEVRRLARAGAAEVVLTGVDMTSYGADLPGRPPLGRLVSRILKLVPELPRLRLSSIDAAEIDDELLRSLAEEPRLTPYLHLSLQSGDDMILKRMKRRHSRAQAEMLVQAVRAVRPETAFGADLIAGFPTETEAMADNSVSLVEDLGLSYLHVFPFSPRPGTPAARMPQLERGVIKARAERLRRAGAAALQRHLQAQIGRTLSVVVEQPGTTGHAEDFTEVRWEMPLEPGGLAAMRVTGHDGRRARAVPA
jgi:threonylcarbamoyladenosine tRNA methylthiotransferase MtaB